MASFLKKYVKNIKSDCVSKLQTLGKTPILFLNTNFDSLKENYPIQNFEGENLIFYDVIFYKVLKIKD